MIEIFATLLLAHLLADFPLQTNTIARLKAKGGWGLIPHIIMHVLMLALLIQDPITQIALLILLGCIHWLIDWIKVTYTNPRSLVSFVGDQIVHLISLLVIVLILPLISLQQPEPFLPPQMLYPALVYAVGLGIMVFCWVWANSLDEQTANQYVYIRWVRDRMLSFSQKAGYILLVGMTSWTFSQMFNLVS